MTLLYRFALTLLWPVLALLVWAHPRLRKHAAERLGFPDIEVQPGAVWIHAASLGEGRAASALIAAFREADPGIEILRSCTSDVAHGQRVGADQTLALPIDVPMVMEWWLNRVRPRCLILVEAELWPGLLWACERRGVPVAVAGARIGKGTRRLLGFWPGLMWGLRWFPADAATAKLVGGEPIGDLKREAERPGPALEWRHARSLVAGSTHEGEEAALLDAVETLAPRPLLVLAPRDRARFDDVAMLLATRNERFVRRSRLERSVPDEVDVVLLDTLGELAGLYGKATAAYVGGTYDVRIGGHSPAEARAAGCPIVHGPHTESNPAGWEGLDGFLALAPDDLAEAITEAFDARVEAAEASAERTASRAVVVALADWLARPIPAERALRPWLYPLVPLWMLGVRLRPRPYRKAPIPVISVGALTAGGSGKTPVAAWLAERLRDPVVVARGYGRRRGNDVRLDGEAGEVGDELAMLARRGHRVASSPDRLAGIVAAAAKGARVAILDDGLQVGDVARDLEIVVVDARWPRGGGPIPVGTCRVPPSWLGRADIVWVNHGPLPASLRAHLRAGAVVVQARYRPAGWIHRGRRHPFVALPRKPVMALAGIARPEGFFRMLRACGIHPARTMVFPDHHPFVWSDLQSIEAWLDDHVVLTTEKDAARLPPDAGVWALAIEIEILEGEEALERALARFKA